VKTAAKEFPLIFFAIPFALFAPSRFSDSQNKKPHDHLIAGPLEIFLAGVPTIEAK